jgi:hypothetical protein
MRDESSTSIHANPIGRVGYSLKFIGLPGKQRTLRYSAGFVTG